MSLPKIPREALVFVLAMAWGCRTPEKAPPTLVQKSLTFQLPVFPKAAPHDLKEDLGTVVFLDVWATWCEVCKDAIPAYGQMLQPFGQQVRTYAISVDEDARQLSAYLEKRPLPFPVLWDQGGRLAERVLEVQVMPTGFLLDRRGVVRYVHKGYSPELPARIRDELEKLLSERP